jgi:hypothetical protein
MSHRWSVILGLLVVLIVVGGCTKDTEVANPAGGSDAKDGGVPAGPAGIKVVMMQIGRGQMALTPVIGKELESDPPPWDKVQPQAKRYAELAGALTKTEPMMGKKDSWQKHTKDFAQSATALEKAAQTKDRPAALAAHKELTEACAQCHQEHRGKGPKGE